MSFVLNELWKEEWKWERNNSEISVIQVMRPSMSANDGNLQEGVMVDGGMVVCFG